MVTTKVQEVVRNVLKETDELHNEISRAIKYDDKEHAFETFLRSRLNDFTHYASLAQRMTAEVSLNLSKDLRPAQELTYLENLESFVKSIDNTYSDVETQEWEDTIRIRLQNPLASVNRSLVKVLISSVEKELASELIEQVRVCCYRFDLECKEIAENAKSSFFVQNNPHKFPNILSYLPSPEPTEQVAQVDESVEPSFKDVEEKPPINQKEDIKSDRPIFSVKLQWKGDKTDLAELIWTLAKSGRVTDTSTGKDVTLKELATQIVALLGFDSLDIASLMKGRYGTASKPTSYKVQDGKTFINELQKHLDSRVLD